jgi:hypothetical protein
MTNANINRRLPLMLLLIAASFVVTAHTSVSAASKPNKDLLVNGHKLRTSEKKWVLFIATDVVPRLAGDRDQRLTVASRATWWALKEGVFGLSNPPAHSVCNRKTKAGKRIDVRLSPLEVCEPRMAWQVGVAGVQVPNVTDDQVTSAASKLQKTNDIATLLTEAAKLAGHRSTDATFNQIVNSQGVLRKSWLLRHPALGVTFVNREVKSECIDDSRKWCYGTGWDQTKRYSPNKPAALQAIADLRQILALHAP